MNVLIVDDDPWVRTILTDILEFEGIHTLAAPDGPAALKLVSQGPAVDAILMDYHMPGMDGVTAIRSLQSLRQLRHTRIFLMSAEWPAQRLADELGIAFIRKPFDIPQLLDWLRAPETAAAVGVSRRFKRSEPKDPHTESQANVSPDNTDADPGTPAANALPVAC